MKHIPKCLKGRTSSIWGFPKSWGYPRVIILISDCYFPRKYQTSSERYRGYHGYGKPPIFLPSRRIAGASYGIALFAVHRDATFRPASWARLTPAQVRQVRHRCLKFPPIFFGKKSRRLDSSSEKWDASWNCLLRKHYLFPQQFFWFSIFKGTALGMAAWP